MPKPILPDKDLRLSKSHHLVLAYDVSLNASITYRINKKKHASIYSIQILNLLGSEKYYGYRFNYRTDAIEEDSQVVVVPSISYKIEF